MVESGNRGGEGFGGGADPCCRARTEPNMVLITVRNLAHKCTNLRCPGCHLSFLLIHPRSSFVSRREKTACGRVLSFGPQRACKCKWLIGWTLRICSLQSMFAESGGGDSDHSTKRGYKGFWWKPVDFRCFEHKKFDCKCIMEKSVRHEHCDRCSHSWLLDFSGSADSNCFST